MVSATGGTPGTIHVLHVDDESDFADMAGELLEREDDRFVVSTVTSAADGLEYLAGNRVDCIVSDYDMPGRDGVEFLRRVRDDHPDLPFILYTGKGSEEVASEAISAGVTDYLQKGSGSDRYALLANRITNAVVARRSATEAARTRQRLTQVLKTVPACVVQFDREGRFVFANERAVEVLGLERSDVTDRTYNDPAWEIRDLDGESIPDEELPFRRVLESGDPLYGFRHTIQWPDGTRKTLLVNGAPLFDDAGDVESVVFSLSSVTDREEREEHLRKTTARLEALFENSPDMINVHDEAGTIIDPNPRLCEETGYDEAELTGMKVWDLDRSIDPAEARAIWAEMESGDRRELEGVYRRSDGSTFPVEVHVRRLSTEEGDRFVAISRDVSGRAEHAHELERYRAYTADVLDAIDDLFFVQDESGSLHRWNRSFKEVTGYSDEEIGSMDGTEFVPEANRDRAADAIRRVFETGHGRLEAPLLTADGTTIPYEFAASHVTTPRGESRLVGIGRDITERKRRECALQQERDRLEEFASIVSHDLRNPLNVATGQLSLAREECEEHHLDAIDRALARMDDLIGDLLTLARRGERVSDVEVIALPDLIETCWRSVETAEAELRVAADGTIRADRGRLRQLLENLFRNAIEHGGAGVTVTVGGLPEGFYVADDGPGIPEDEREAVFDAGYSNAEGGTGVGLFIVAQVADTHGWDVGVTESADGGTRFEITGVAFAG